MSEPVTPLGFAVTEGLVTVTACPAQGMITIRGDLTDTAITTALSDVAGVAMPQMRQTTHSEATGLLWMSPDEALMLCPYGDVAQYVEKLNGALSGQHALVADVSDARTLIALDGAAVREVLAKVTPADLRPQSLPVGELRRTRLSQVAGAFWFSSETRAQVICFRSVSGYVFELLSTSAAPDSAVGYF